jgi:hypothetical protein
MNPGKCINETFHIESLVEADVLLEPLFNSLKTLHRGLSLQGGNNNDEIPLNHWKKILTMTSISTQRQKLKELSDKYCQSLLQLSPSIFDSILKHKCLHSQISIKNFDLKPVIDEGLEYRFIDATCKEESNNKIQNLEFNKGYPLTLLSNESHYEYNQFFVSQRYFRTCFVSYLPIYESLFKLDSTKASIICSFYVSSVQEKLYVRNIHFQLYIVILIIYFYDRFL